MNGSEVVKYTQEEEGLNTEEQVADWNFIIGLHRDIGKVLIEIINGIKGNKKYDEKKVAEFLSLVALLQAVEDTCAKQSSKLVRQIVFLKVAHTQKVLQLLEALKGMEYVSKKHLTDIEACSSKLEKFAEKVGYTAKFGALKPEAQTQQATQTSNSNKTPATANKNNTPAKQTVSSKKS